MNYSVDSSEGKFSILCKCDGNLIEKNFDTEEERDRFISDTKISCKNFEVIDVCDGVCECNECCDKNNMTFERKDDMIIVSVVKEKGLGTTEEELGPEDRKFGNDIFNKIYKDVKCLPTEVDGKFCKDCGKAEIIITYSNLSSDEYEKLADYLMKSGYKSVEKSVERFDESKKEPFSDFSNLIEFGFVKIGGEIKIAIQLAFDIGEVESSEVGKFFGSISKESEALSKEIASITGKDANSHYDFCNFDHDNCYHAIVWTYDDEEEFIEMLRENGIEENDDATFFDVANH